MRLAVVDPAYDPFATWPGPITFPKVTFEGEDVLDEVPYAVLNGYVPMAGDRVLMIPVGDTYAILGRIGNAVDVQGFWTDTDSSGVELGGGSYFSSDEGLHLEGDLEVTGVGATLDVVRTVDSAARTSTVLTADDQLSIPLTVGSWEIEAWVPYAASAVGDITADILVGWAVPPGASRMRFSQGPIPGMLATTAGATTAEVHPLRQQAGFGATTGVQYGTNGTNGLFLLERLLYAVTTAGSVTLTWARAGGSGSTIVRAGAHLTARRYA
jgi:hypothetical protein